MLDHGIAFVFYTILLSLINSQSYISRTVSQFNWISAEPLCSFLYDTNLASIHNEEELDEALSLCSTSSCWIGLHDRTTENTFEWADGSSFDYGTNITGGVYPWDIDQPNNYHQASEDCVVLENNRWYDKHCQVRYRDEILCNYPSPIYVFKDNPNYQRIPSFAKSIGKIDVLDEIYVEFSFKINAFTADGWTNIFHIGSIDNIRAPGVWLWEPTKHFYVNVNTVKQHEVTFSPDALNTNQWYNLSIYVRQNHLAMTLDGINIYDNITGSHQIVMDQDIYLGDPWHDTSDVVLSGLTISTSNTYYNPNNDAYFNYLCDYVNRFTVKNGTWFYEDSSCYLTKLSFGGGNVVWIGDKETYSTDWVNYKIELIYTITEGDDAGLIIRARSVGSGIDEGQHYNIHISVVNQKIIFAKIDEFASTKFVVLNEYTVNSIAYNVEFRLRVEANSGMFLIFFQDEYMFTVSDISYSSGSIGIRDYYSKAIYKSIRITFPTDNYLLTVNPTPSPSNTPTQPTKIPSISPTKIPSVSPTNIPSQFPSVSPTKIPSVSPTNMPSASPTNIPSTSPTNIPSETPTKLPSDSPLTLSPTNNPTLIPTKIPTLRPTSNPTKTKKGEVPSSMNTTKNSANSGGDEEKSETNILYADVIVIILLIFAFALCLIIGGLIILIYRKRRRSHKQKENENAINPKLNEPGSKKHSVIIDEHNNNNDDAVHIKVDKSNHKKIELQKIDKIDIKIDEYSRSSSSDGLFDVVSSTDNNTTMGSMYSTPEITQKSAAYNASVREIPIINQNEANNNKNGTNTEEGDV